MFQPPARPIFFPRIDDSPCREGGFIPLPPLSTVSTTAIKESSQWFGGLVKRTPGKRR